MFLTIRSLGSLTLIWPRCLILLTKLLLHLFNTRYLPLLEAYGFFWLLGIVTNVRFFVLNKLFMSPINLLHFTLVTFWQVWLITATVFPCLRLAVRTHSLESLEIQISCLLTIGHLATTIFIHIGWFITLRLISIVALTFLQICFRWLWMCFCFAVQRIYCSLRFYS